MPIRDEGLGADLDILALGSRSERMRLDGTIRVSGIGKMGDVEGDGEKVRLNVSARVRHSSRCCDWSSPTGTMVDLRVQRAPC